MVICLAQLLGSFVATSQVTGLTRTAVLLVVFPLITTLFYTAGVFRSRYSIIIVATATVTTFACIRVSRQYINTTWFIGVLPADLELTGYGVLTAITLVCAQIANVVFSSTGTLRKSRWVVLGTISILLVSLAVFARLSVWEPSPSDLLRTIVRTEQQHTTDAAATQMLSVMLANCGRETDAESVNRWDVSGHGLVQTRSPRLKSADFNLLPWRQTFTEIANREQLILIMEAHNAPKHRQWIEQTLSILRDAGFRDYAAEGLAESGRSLRQRGYPVSSTGFYVSDPHFGNVLRTAIELGFNLHSYEAHGKDYLERESEQATNLTKLFAENPKLKLVVHAGYAHILKTPHETGEKLMAAQLWEKTGIEPYCIWQTWHSPEEDEAGQIAQMLPVDSDPMMLVPIPVQLHDPQFKFPPNAVDALVVHHPSIGGPDQRVHSSKSARRRVTGVWNSTVWPVLIGAFKKGESADAIALDQVMLRQGEKDFVLWVPTHDFEIRMFGLNGRINSAHLDASAMMTIKLELPKSKPLQKMPVTRN